MKLDIQNLLQLKKYFSGIDSIKWSYQKYLEGISFQELIRNPTYQMEHNEIIMKGVPKLFSTKLPRETATKQDLTLKRVSIKVADQSYSASKVWEGLYSKIPTWIKTKPYIINLYSEVGEMALSAGSVLVKHLQDSYKESGKKLKLKVTTGASLEYSIKDFGDSDSNISKIADVDVLVVFSYNSISSSDFNKAKIQTLFEECQLRNTIVILTSKTEQNFKGFTQLNIPFSDSYKNETQLINDLGL